MNSDPQPPRKSRMFLLVVGIILAIVVIFLIGSNISHYIQMR